MQDNNSSHNAPWSDQQQQHNQQQQSNGDSGSNRNDDHQQQQYDAGDEPPLEYGIFVSDIARGVTDEELKDAFSSAGQVTEALVVKNKFTGETKGFGFVKFATLDAVHAALDMSELPAFRDAVSNRVQTVKVVRADPKNVLYVGNIPRGLSEDDVRLALQEATTTYEVTKFKLCTTLEGESKGYGWVTFKDHKCAVQGMRLLQTTPVFGLYLTIHMAEPRTQEEDMLARVKSLFVRGVTPTTNAEAMKAFFGEGCEKVVIPVDVTTRAVLGHAFVHFSSRQQAELALQRCQNGTLEGESQPLTMEWCLPKEFIRGKGRGTPLRGGPDMEMGGYEGSWGGPPPPPGGNYGGGWDDPSYYDDGSGRWGGAYRGGGFRGRGAPHRGGVPHRGRGGVYRGGYGGPPLPPPPLPPHYGAAGPYGMPHHHHHYPPPPPPVPHYYPPAYGHYQPPAYGYGHPPASAHGYPHPAAAMQTSTGASSADPYAGYYDHSAAGSGYAYPPVPPPPDYTQGYYGSPAGGKALVPRDNPRYNPY